MPTKYKTIYKKILNEIDRAHRVMLVMHQKPDGDTVGSALAMAHYLDTVKKPHTCFCVDELSPTLKFLPGSQKVTNDDAEWHPVRAEFDLVIVFDSGDLKYAGIDTYIDRLTHNFKIINIDHHETNKDYGHHNLVIRNASSTCEIVHDLLHSVDALNKEIATCLMTGLVTDTGGFTNLATTASSIEAASKLLLKGANMKAIAHKTIKNKSLATLKLWGRALERLSSADGLVTTVITQQDMQECGAGLEALEGVSNFLNSLDKETDAKAILVLAEQEPGMIKGSFRTTHPLIDVAKLATLFGGGGHKKAAGFTIPGELKQVDGKWKIVQTTTTSPNAQQLLEQAEAHVQTINA